MTENVSTVATAPRRSAFIDILKAFGIIAVVIGHSVAEIFGFQIGRFVYTYHLMLFFFVFGFLFSKKRVEDPQKAIGKTVCSLAKLFITYEVLFILLRNLLITWGLTDEPPYSWQSIVYNVFNAFTLNNTERLAGAMWFVQFYLFAAIFFTLLVALCERAKRPLFLHLATAVIFAFVGPWLVINSAAFGWRLPYYMHNSILGLPVMYMGYFCKLYWNKIKPFVRWWSGLAVGVVIYIILLQDIGSVELSRLEILHPALFYPVTALGIYFCMGFALLAEKITPVCRALAYVGKNSFHIMALHFTAIKLVDVIVGNIKGDPAGLIVTFPYAYDLWYIYIPVGVLLPLCWLQLAKLCKRGVLWGVSWLKQKIARNMPIAQ